MGLTGFNRARRETAAKDERKQIMDPAAWQAEAIVTPPVPDSDSEAGIGTDTENKQKRGKK